jgi:hypothetical protein
MKNLIIIFLIAITGAGCGGSPSDPYDTEWATLETGVKGYLSPSVYSSNAVEYIEQHHSNILINTFKSEGPCYQTKESLFHKDERRVRIYYRKCHTEEKLLNHQNPIILEDVDVMLDVSGKVVSIYHHEKGEHNVENDFMWTTHELLYLGKTESKAQTEEDANDETFLTITNRTQIYNCNI